MGKASSAKKIARAARSGDHKSVQQSHLGYPIALAVLVVLGFALVTYSRQSGAPAQARAAKPGDQNAAYAIFVCDHFVVNAYGVVGAGEKFPTLFAGSDTSVTDSEITLPKSDPYNHRVYKEGTTKCDGKPATIKVVHWKSAVKASQGAKPDRVYTSGFADIKNIGDLSAITIAFVPPGTTAIPPPPNAGDLTSDSVATAEEPTATTSTTTLVTNDAATTLPTATVPAGGGTTTP